MINSLNASGRAELDEGTINQACVYSSILTHCDIFGILQMSGVVMHNSFREQFGVYLVLVGCIDLSKVQDRGLHKSIVFRPLTSFVKNPAG